MTSGVAALRGGRGVVFVLSCLQGIAQREVSMLILMRRVLHAENRTGYCETSGSLRRFSRWGEQMLPCSSNPDREPIKAPPLTSCRSKSTTAVGRLVGRLKVLAGRLRWWKWSKSLWTAARKYFLRRRRFSGHFFLGVVLESSLLGSVVTSGSIHSEVYLL